MVNKFTVNKNMSKVMKVSIIVVAHNEEKNIANCLHSLMDHFSKKNYNYEIIVSEDGSTDKTYAIAKKFEKKYKNIKVLHDAKKLGKGGGIIKGFKNARGDIVIFTDTDLAAPPPEIDKLIKEIDSGYDVAVASKYVKGSEIIKKPPMKKIIASKSFNILVNLFFNLGIKDTQCGLKAIKKGSLEKIINNLTKTGWDFDVEFLLRSKQNKLKIKEIPVVWSHKEETTKFSFLKDSIKMGLGIFEMWLKENLRKLDLIFILLFSSFFLMCLFLTKYSIPNADEGTHNLLGLFFYDLFRHLIKNPAISINKIYSFFIEYLIHYPKLSLYYPPFFYILLSLMFNIFGISFFVGSLTTLIFSLGSLFMIYLFSKKHIGNFDSALISSLFYVLSPIIILLSIKTLTDVPILFFFLTTLYCYLNAILTNKTKWFILSSISFALGFLTKWNIILIVPIIFVYAILDFRKSIKKLILSFFLLAFLLSPYLYLAFKFNIPIIVEKTSIEVGVSEKDPQWTSLEGWLYYTVKLSDSYLSYPLMALSLVALIFYSLKKYPHWKLFLIWFILVYLFFTWLTNKDPRYIIIIFPSLIFPFAYIISLMKKKIKIVSALSISIILIISSFYYLEPILNYKIDYDRITSKITKEGNILLASENSWFYSSAFMFNIASKEDRLSSRKIYRPCVLDETNLKNLLDTEGIRYVIVAEPIRDIHMKNIQEINTTQQLQFISNIEGKNLRVIIYENNKYNFSKTECNYICLLKKWICLNDTSKISTIGANL
jgi:glycosyltransferase involved in cell wall biosynthesis